MSKPMLSPVPTVGQKHSRPEYIPVPASPIFQRVAAALENEKKSAFEAKLVASRINFYYGSFQALHGINLDFAKNKITALIGPSGCGKSTFIRTLNRMHETVRGARLEGTIMMDNENILKHDVNVFRRRVGMVFQKS